MKIGNRLKYLRNESGVLQKVLAEQLNLSQQTISLYESDNRQPDYETLTKIANYFNVSTDYILGLSNIREPINTVVEKAEEYVLNEKFNTYFTSKSRNEAIEILDQLYELSPESQEEIKKLIKMYGLWEEQKKNPRGSGGFDIKE